MGPFNDAQYVQQFLEQPGVLADRRLRDLAKYVIITSFDISAGQVIAATRPPLNWRPKVFQNLSPDGADMELRAVDAAMCSSASPITTAVHMGKVDGGLIANNPAMVAVGQVFAEGVRPTALSARFPTDYHGIQMLSVGGGRSGEAFAVRSANWGYFKWLLDPSNLLLLLNGFLSGTTEAISMQSGQILNESKFRRLDPFYIERGLLPFVQADPSKQQATAESALTQEMVEETADWLRRTGWVDESKPVTAAVAVA
jgi:patatin-like phospholipase/acyl hydrolase